MAFTPPKSSGKELKLKSFLRSSKSVLIGAVIPALLKLVAHDADGRSTSLADEFELILEEDNVHKSYILYKERRFSKLGYSAASLFDCLPQFEKLLERATENNLLIRGCELYLESDFIRAALKALDNFTYYDTMPFLNCIERCDQNQLVELLRKLHDDLEEKNIFSEALKPFHVLWKHVNMESQKPSSDLDHYLLDEMCFNASKGIKIQCAREYWKDHGFTEGRVTSIVDLSED